MPRKPQLSVIPPQPSAVSPPAPASLKVDGAALWHDVVSNYEFHDAAAYMTLQLACEALDRAAELREAINHDGPVVRTKAGLKDHPGLKHELANRAFVTRALARLGLDLEPIRPLGRPGGGSFA